MAQATSLNEPLLLVADGKHQPNRFFVLGWQTVYLLFSLLLGSAICFLRSVSLSNHPQIMLQHHRHVQPTLLSVVDPETMEYLVVSEHPNYPIWQTTLKRTTTESDGHKLRLDKAALFQVKDSLTLSWQALENVTDNDVLALFCGENDHFLEAATIKEARATSQRHGGGNDAHSWYIPSFPIIREPSCQFVLYQQRKAYAMIPIASSPHFELFMSDTPTNIHLALGDDDSSMIIHFSTGSNPGTPVAMYGKGANPTVKVDGTSSTYEASDMCGSPANLTGTGQFMSPGMLHTVELTNLQPDAQYSYKVGYQYGQGVVWSDVFTFQSAPAVGNSSNPYVYIVYGDQGCPSVGWGEGGEWTSGMVARETDARAVHHLGDLSYARGAAHIWEEWLTMVERFATRIPLMIAVGNHEYDHTIGGENGKDPSGVNSTHGFMPIWGNFGDDSGGECGVPTVQRFRMPKSKDNNSVFWYSYSSSTVHTVVLSSEHDLSPGSRQHKWLTTELKAVNRTLTPWVVVELHRPLYMNEELWADNAVGIGMRMEFEALFKIYHVDLVLSGHYHSYFRSCAGLFQSQCNNGGPTHIIVGTAGAYLDNSKFYSNHWSVKNIQGEYGYGRITVANSTAMHFEFVKAGAEDDKTSGKVLDEVWITKTQSS